MIDETNNLQAKNKNGCAVNGTMNNNFAWL